MGVKVRKKPQWPFILVSFPLMLLMSACIVYPYVKALDLEPGIIGVLLINSAWLLLFTLAFRSVKTTLALVAAIVVAGGIVAAQYFIGAASKTPTEFNTNIESYVYWAGNYLSGFRTAHPLYFRITTAIYSFAVCFPIALFTVRRLDAFAVSFCGAACFVSLVVIGHTVNLPSLYGCILSAVLYFLLQNYMTNTREVQGAKTKGLPSYMASTLPFAAAVLALTIVLSATLWIDPAWMKETRDKLIKKNEQVGNAVASMSGSLIISTTELGGAVILNNDVLMEVDSPTGSLYLRGMSRDVYTGHSWEQSDRTPIGYYLSLGGFDDTTETTTIFELTNSMELRDRLLKRFMISVRYTGMNPRVIYLPLKTYDINGLSAGLRLSMIGRDTVYLDEPVQGGLKYEVSLYGINYSAPELADVLKACHSGLYDELGNNLAEQQFDLYYQVMARRVDSAKYTQLPASLPARVRDLALDITRGLTNDYDRAKAIESYLSGNYTYTLTPDEFDKTKDFVDEFLFEGKQGYCTYYATAMTVLLRCAGIPARYVEGYVLPGGNTGGVYKVTKKEGHAWVEAYFEGFGWFPFEPTSSFSLSAPALSPGPSPSPSATPVATPAVSATAKPSAGATDTPASAPALKVDLMMPLLLLAAAAALFALICIPLSARARMVRMKPRDAVQAVFAQYLRVLAMQKMEMKNGEPLAEFAARVDGLQGLTAGEFLKAAEVFQLARYSPHGITCEQKDLMLGFRKKLLTASRRGLGLARYLFYRFVWGM